MKLRRLSFTEFEETEGEWRIEPFEVHDVNLLVGRNASGKSRLLNVLDGLALILSGRRKEPYASGRYEVNFADGGQDFIYRLRIADFSILEEVECYVLIYDCSADGRVVSEIRENAASLSAQGYACVLGLRDVYPESRASIERMQETMAVLLSGLPLRAQVLLSVMEIEAWFIGEYLHFSKVNDRLVADRITAARLFDPRTIMVEDIAHPSSEMDAIYLLEGENYIKSREQVQAIVDALDFEHMTVDVRLRAPALGRLVDELTAIFQRANSNG